MFTEFGVDTRTLSKRRICLVGSDAAHMKRNCDDGDRHITFRPRYRRLILDSFALAYRFSASKYRGRACLLRAPIVSS